MAEKNGRGPALVVNAVSKSFGAVKAVQEVGFEVERGSLTCLIGPNGAGKSTLLHCISGFLRQERGRITLEEHEVSRWPAHRRARAGLGTVFQVMRAPPDLDVLESTRSGRFARRRRPHSKKSGSPSAPTTPPTRSRSGSCASSRSLGRSRSGRAC